MTVQGEVRGATVGEVEILYNYFCTISNFKLPQTRETRWKVRVEGGRNHEAGVGLDRLMKGAAAATDLQNRGAGLFNLASCAMSLPAFIFNAAAQVKALVHFVYKNVARD